MAHSKNGTSTVPGDVGSTVPKPDRFIHMARLVVDLYGAVA